MITHTYPQVRILEVAAVVLDDVRAVTLLHDGDLLDDLLQVRVYRYLLDSQDLARGLV